MQRSSSSLAITSSQAGEDRTDLCHMGFTKGGLHSSIGSMPTSKQPASSTDREISPARFTRRWTECQRALGKRPFGKPTWLVLQLPCSKLSPPWTATRWSTTLSLSDGEVAFTGRAIYRDYSGRLGLSCGSRGRGGWVMRGRQISGGRDCASWSLRFVCAVWEI